MDDSAVRLATFAFLDEQRQIHPDGLPWRMLHLGFVHAGTRVPLISQQGIFKPRICELPLSIRTAAFTEGETRPYDDALGEDGLLLYRYRGTDTAHRENVGLRLAQQRQTPLVYFQGIVEGLYEAAYPVFIVGDDPARLTFTVSVDERRFAAFGNAPADPVEADIRRRYVTRLVQQRLHQASFRERVLAAYQRHCAVCRLKRAELLQAAHIVADSDERGEPIVSNGLALCSLHHAAFDSHLIAIRPDYRIQVRSDVLGETDGPMLIHGLQGFHDQLIRLPRLERHWPNRDLLEARYGAFSRAI